MIKKMEEEFKYGLMVVDMKVNGKIIRQMDMEEWSMPKVIYLREIGAMTKQMDKAPILK